MSAAVIAGGRGKPPMSGLDAAAKVLEEAGYWWRDGQRPWAAIYSAIIPEIGDKGYESRFATAGRGLFARTA